MNMMQKKVAARSMTVNALAEVLESLSAVQFGDANFAVLQEVDGQEVWTEISVKAKSFTDTKVSPAFDPFEVAQVWQEEKQMKEEARAQKAKEKAEKIARDEAAREEKRKAKEQAQAKEDE